MLMADELSPFFQLSLADFPITTCYGHDRNCGVYYWGMSNLYTLDFGIILD